MKQLQRGFTLIELVMVIAILAILAAVAIPQYVDLKTQATTSAKAGVSGAVKSTHAVLMVQKAAAGTTPVNPTVAEIAAGMTPNGTAVASGVTSNGYTVPTFTAANCTGATTATSDVVLCVGDAP